MGTVHNFPCRNSQAELEHDNYGLQYVSPEDCARIDIAIDDLEGVTEIAEFIMLGRSFTALKTDITGLDFIATYTRANVDRVFADYSKSADLMCEFVLGGQREANALKDAFTKAARRVAFDALDMGEVYHNLDALQELAARKQS